MKTLFKSVVISAVVLTSGCASLTHYNKTKISNIGDKQSQQIISIDAKQRVVTSTINDDKIRTCAEPSPDALSAIAASQGFSLNNDSLEAALSNSVGEGASSIGLRTQSIQLMRDAMYRLCEGYMSEAMDHLTFETLHRRFQTTMVAILAIEQLTGTVKAPTVAIGTSSSSGNPELVSKYTEMTEAKKTALEEAKKARDDHKNGDYETARKALETKKTEVSAEDGDANDDLTDDEKAKFKAETDAFNTAEEKLASLNKTVELKESDYDAANSARIAALSGSTNASSEVKVTEGQSQQNAAHLSAVSSAVAKIVETTVQLGFSREFCTTVLVDTVRHKTTTYKSSAYDPTTDLRRRCLDYLATNTNIRNAEADLIRAKSEIVAGVLQGNPTNEELLALMAMVEGYTFNAKAPPAFSLSLAGEAQSSSPSNNNKVSNNGKSGYTTFSKTNSSARTELVSVPAIIKTTTIRVMKNPASITEDGSVIPAVFETIKCTGNEDYGWAAGTDPRCYK